MNPVNFYRRKVRATVSQHTVWWSVVYLQCVLISVCMYCQETADRVEGHRWCWETSLLVENGVKQLTCRGSEQIKADQRENVRWCVQVSTHKVEGDMKKIWGRRLRERESFCVCANVSNFFFFSLPSTFSKRRFYHGKWCKVQQYIKTERMNEKYWGDRAQVYSLAKEKKKTSEKRRKTQAF